VKYLAISAVLLAAGRALAQTSGPALTDVRVQRVGHDTDPSAVVCQAFRLSNQEAASFFAKAIEVTPHEMHYKYDQAPCYVRGVALVARKPVSWEIRAAGTAWVRLADGTTHLLVDPKQQENDK
jgi:hypothetical protein